MKKVKMFIAALITILIVTSILSAAYTTPIYFTDGRETMVVGTGGLIDVNGGLFKLTPISTPPSGYNVEGVFYYDSDDHVPYFYNGSTLVSAGAGSFTGGTITSDIVMKDGEYIRTSTTTAHATALQVYDLTAAAAYKNVLSWVNGEVPDIVLGAVTNTFALASTALNIDTSGNMSGIGTMDITDNVTIANGKSIQSDNTTAHTMLIRGYDDNSSTYRNMLTITNGDDIAGILGNAYSTMVISTSDWGIDATGAQTKMASIGFDGGATIYHKVIAIDNAAVQTLFSVPSTLVSAPGTHNIVDVLSVVVFYNYATAAFNTAAYNISAQYCNGNTAVQAATSAISQTGTIDQTSHRMFKLIPVAIAATTAANCENLPVKLYCATADPTTGGGSLTVQISYRIIPTGW